MEDLDQLIPVGREVQIGALTVSVRPLVVRQLSAFAKVLRSVPPTVIDDVLSGRLNVLELAEHTDALVEAVAIATDTPLKDLGALTPDHLSTLVGAVIEVNVDFFMARLAPAMSELAAVASRLLARVGPIASSGSSPTATAAPIS